MPLCVPEYNLIEIHKLMLMDNIRINGYWKAICKRVNATSFVLDFGSGSGILSLAAAKAGARKIYAVERTKIAEVSKKIISDNELSDKIYIVNVDSKNALIPEKVDILVSEWMGIHVFQENMLFDLIDIRDKYLKKDGKMIPEKVSLFVAPLRVTPLSNDEINRWEYLVEGFSFKEIFNLSLNDTYICKILPEMLASNGFCALTLDLYTVNKEELETVEMTTEFAFSSHDEINGICGWFSAQLTDDIVLDTSPFSAPTHWKQTVYPIHPKIEVNAGDALVLQIIVEPAEDFSHFTWIAYVKGKETSTYRKFSTRNNYTLPSVNKISFNVQREEPI